MSNQNIYRRFGEIIYQLRVKNGWRQDDLARISGYSRGSIANIEAGRQRVLLHTVLDFAGIFRVKPSDLFRSMLQGWTK